MERRSIILWGVILALVAICSGCTRIVHHPVEYQADTRKYDSAFPYGDMAGELKTAFDSIKRILVTGNYQTFLFNPEDEVTLSKIRQQGVETFAIDRVSYTESKAGTATIIATSDQSVALLTCAHVVTMADTLYQYFEAPGVEPETLLQSVSIKTDQANILFDQPSLGVFTVIASDPVRDLAILGVRFFGEREVLPRATRNRLGNSQDLELGSFVYVLGYPRGHQMVHNGLVSGANYDGRGGFITNALFNPGISGAPIFARRSADSRLEMVGIAKGAQGGMATFLVPDLSTETEYNPYLPYIGPAFVSGFQQINYGITFSVSTDQIRDFLDENRQRLSGRGYGIAGWAAN